jgi:hypothetical protein
MAGTNMRDRERGMVGMAVMVGSMVRGAKGYKVGLR